MSVITLLAKKSVFCLGISPPPTTPLLETPLPIYHIGYVFVLVLGSTLIPRVYICGMMGGD